MRRSAAPSIRGGIKKARYLPHLIQNISSSDKENDCFLRTTIELPVSSNGSSNSSNVLLDFSSIAHKDEVKIRSNEDILDLIEADSTTNETSMKSNNLPEKVNIFDNPLKNEKCSTSAKSVKATIINNSVLKKVVEENCSSLSNCIYCTKNMEEVSLFNVVYCKRSGKKHKTWEGDGVLIVKSRSAVLKDFSGKTLDKGLGYKLKETESLEDGCKFFIGGKECEILNKIPEEEYQSGKYCKCISNSKQSTEEEKPLIDIKKTFKRFYPPISFINTKPRETTKNMYEQNTVEETYVLPLPTPEQQMHFNKSGLPVVDVYVDSFLTKQLRSHQKEGISFMYKCIMGFQHEFGRGVILADEMGLGKTLQCIALIWTLFKCGPFGSLPVLKNVIIITPSSLVTNWQNEFYKWLGKSRLPIFAVNQKNTVKDFVKLPKAVLIISYEMFLRSSEHLSSVKFDLVVCDEGHRIKNLNIKISNVINCLSTTRRILLTGTPIQNDLAEFFSIVDFVNPGALGTLQSFRKNFEKPINQSRNQDCSESEKEYGDQMSEELGNMTKLFMLRRTQEVINQYLPPKTETVIFCRPSELQRKLYNHLLKSRTVIDILTSAIHTDTSTPLVCISLLRKLCNHPSLLYKTQEKEENSTNKIVNYMESAFPAGYQIPFTDSGKMKVLENMLSSIFSFSSKKITKEKVVIVSGFTKTLDILEQFCKQKHYEFLRLDGSTSSNSRQDIVDVFNYSYTKYSVFLLSSKAGGVGFNLVGASRIILYDIDWNPANDLQAMARIWRDGQKHEVYVYRLLTTGTIEEKMYQRQLSKQCLSGSVLDSKCSKKIRFSKEELKDLFTFHEDSRCVTHDIINCKCLSLAYLLNMDEFENLENFDSMEQKNVGMAELMNWSHICGPISSANCSDSCLINGGSDITFLFQNTVNNTRKKI